MPWVSTQTLRFRPWLLLPPFLYAYHPYIQHTRVQHLSITLKKRSHIPCQHQMPTVLDSWWPNFHSNSLENTSPIVAMALKISIVYLVGLGLKCGPIVNPSAQPPTTSHFPSSGDFQLSIVLWWLGRMGEPFSRTGDLWLAVLWISLISGRIDPIGVN